MKITNVKTKKYKLLHLYLLKDSSYRVIPKSTPMADIIENLELNFKNSLTLIYKYHIENKKILFLGLPDFKQTKLLTVIKLSKHYFIPNTLWLNGLLINKRSVLNYIKSKNLVYFLNINTKPDLIVLFNPKNPKNILSEAKKLNIPVVLFGDILKEKGDYNSINSNKSNYFLNFYQFLLYLILKTPKN